MNNLEELGSEILSNERADHLLSAFMNDIQKKRRSRRIRGLSLGTIAVFALGGLSTAGALMSLSINGAGQSYGPVRDAPANSDPELILAVGDGGVTGYILATDLNGPTSTNPEEVAAWLLNNPADRDRVIPLYKQDGTTVIGTFTVKAPVVIPNEGTGSDDR